MDEECVGSLTRARALLQRGQYGDALAICNRIVGSHPDEYEAYELRSSIHRGMDNLEASIADIDRVILLVPNSAAPHFRKGRYLGLMSRYAEAVPEFTRAIELDVGYFGETILFHRAEALLQSRDYEGALRDCQRLNPDHTERHFYGYSQRGREDIEREAKALLFMR